MMPKGKAVKGVVTPDEHIPGFSELGLEIEKLSFKSINWGIERRPVDRRSFTRVGELDLRLFSVRVKQCELIKADPWNSGPDVMLRITAEVDARDSGQPINIAHQVALPVQHPPYDVDHFIRGPMFHKWLRGELMALLAHEVDESIYRDGLLVDDPHARPPVPAVPVGPPLQYPDPYMRRWR